jgi:UDP-3-O-[3-hydroxymyristoyl] N-acetylglucosamine deacetylase
MHGKRLGEIAKKYSIKGQIRSAKNKYSEQFLFMVGKKAGGQNWKMKSIKITGVGIHSGNPSNIVVKPAKSGGIVFIKNGVRIPAKYDNVSDTSKRNTTIGNPPAAIQTIEHLMAALFVCKIANAEIIIDSSEPPILDGSASKFIKMLKNIKATGKTPIVRIKKTVIARQCEIIKRLPFFTRITVKVANFLAGRKLDGFVKLSPVKGKKLEISARLIYKEPVISDQSYKFVFDYNNFKASAESFVSKVASARTFGKLAEWDFLKKHGMARGCDESNVIALNEGGDGTINGLYYPDEFVRHKIIDVVGDLYTSGCRIVGAVESHKGSHAMNNLALRKLFSDPENYDIIK